MTLLLGLAACGRIGYDALGGTSGGGDGGVGGDGDLILGDGSVGGGNCPVPTVFENELGGSPSASSATSQGSDVLMTWIDSDQLRVQRASVTGAFVGGVQDVVDIDPSILSNHAAGAVAPGGYALPYIRPGGGTATDVFLALLDSSGVPASTNIEMTPSNNSDTSGPAGVAGDGQRVGVLWSSQPGGLRSILLRVRDAAGTLGAIEVMRDPAASLVGIPSVAWNGSRFGVVWSDGEVNFVAATADGARVAAPIVLLAGEGTLGPRIAPYGTGFAVVWRTRLVLIDADGNVLRAATLALDDATVASRGADLLVGGRTGSLIQLERYDANLDPIGEPIPLTMESILTGAPYVSATDDGWLAVWRRSGGLPAFRIATVCE